MFKNPLSTTQDLQDYNIAIVTEDTDQIVAIQKRITTKSAIRLALTVVVVAAGTYVATKLAETDDTKEE